MAKVTASAKSCTVNPLKMSQPVGGALAFMGVKGAMPLLHGSQGCTSFGLVLFVRHFREAIPMQTTAMSEVATVLGGYENVEKAIINIVNRTKPELIGICSTGVTEIKGDDVDGYIRQIRKDHPELSGTPLVYVSTPDFKDAFQDGWTKAVTQLVDNLVPQSDESVLRLSNRVTVLPGSHMTPGDIDEMRDILDCFGLDALFLPDISGSLDGHIPKDFTPTTLGGIAVSEIADLGRSIATLAIGEQMRAPAELLEKRTGVPSIVYDRLTGLGASDALITDLARISGRPVPNKLRRQRGQLVDAMLDGHFHFGGKKVAIGLEPDFLYAMAHFFTEMGATVQAAVTTTHSPLLEQVPADEVVIGDLEDLEMRAAGCNLLVTHSHGRQASDRLQIPLHRLGLPLFDRLGAGHKVSIGYRGTRNMIFEIANIFLANIHEPTPESWRVANEGIATGTELACSSETCSC